MDPLANKHIFLIGPRGSGKSSVGPALAVGMGRDLLDADNYIQSLNNRTISDIFKTDGESGFRKLETKALEKICLMKPMVVATGGGVVLNEVNRKLMAQHGLSVWLKSSERTLLERLWDDRTKGVDRPALSQTGNGDPREALRMEIQGVMAAREPLYQATANWVQETDRKSPDTIAREIINHLSGLI